MDEINNNYRPIHFGLINKKCDCINCSKTNNFIEKAQKVHKSKYNYEKAKYVDSSTKVEIVCPIHGSFFQLPSKHLSGQGCKLCARDKLSEKFRMSLETFKKKANTLHNNKYDYSKVLNFKNTHEKVTIICLVHGEFIQEIWSHLSGNGCPGCANDTLSKLFRMSREEFIERSAVLHNNYYDYSEVDYINNSTPVTIICPIHGRFSQLPAVHINGCNGPKCSIGGLSSLEKQVEDTLIGVNINFVQQKTWDWLVYENKQHVDFYLPDYNLVIECQGRQHFEPVSLFGGQDSYELTVKRDKNKESLCTKHGISLIYYSNLGPDYPYPYEVISDLETLISEIKKIGLTNQF